ncbi:anti-sigma factor family protein [Streptomyces sp. NPDC001544]|uniref:anti-sigma factor family protein n=1 Tax=Streptomyces sp. NPDC001544 TaxID=3364584 RepID=UPI003682F4A8
MSGSRPKPAEGQLAEQHLGDRLSALVDGELGHEARERVLAHLATCARCKAEADAQRRLKNVFAEAAPPPPSESLLARLQGLPGGGDADGGGSPSPGGFSARAADTGVFGVSRGERFAFGYVPARPHTPAAVADRGFRIHPVGRADADRSASRGRRFAFVAAGAVSLAAVALGGVTTGFPADPAADARGGSGTGGSVAPARTTGSGATPASENQRRRQAAPLLAQGTRLGQTSAAPTSVAAPLLPGLPSPAGREQQTASATPLVAGAGVMSPLIRPIGPTPPFTLTTWSSIPEVTGPGLLAAPVPDSTSVPVVPSPSTPSTSSRTAP